MNLATLFFIVMVLTAFVWHFSSLAARLHRTHLRRDQALNSLRQHLALRATCVARLVTSGILDDQTSKALKIGLESLIQKSETSFRDYLSAESDLTGLLVDSFSDASIVANLMESTQSASMIFDLTRSSKRVQLARRFHNDAVGASQLLHSRTAVRLFRLAGHTKVPTTVDLDDRVPEGLSTL